MLFVPCFSFACLTGFLSFQSCLIEMQFMFAMNVITTSHHMEL